MRGAASLARMNSREIDGFGSIADAFDALVIDQFGVLHDGERVYPDAGPCLERLHASGKRMAVLSNSGRRARKNADRLAELGLPVTTIDAVITSGEVAWSALRTRADDFHRRLGRRCVLIAEAADADFVDGLDLEVVAAADDADFLLAVTVGTSADVVAEREPLLQAGARRGIAMLCANDDLVRPAGARLVPAPGALAERYEQLGGRVQRYGKPRRSFFEHCLQALGAVARERVLMVGDSLEHDIRGANDAGLPSVYIRGGIGADLGAAELAARAAAAGAEPTYLMERFRWRRPDRPPARP